jgi:hypothetical protein
MIGKDVAKRKMFHAQQKKKETFVDREQVQVICRFLVYRVVSFFLINILKEKKGIN